MGKTINDLIKEQKDNPPSIDIMGNVLHPIFDEPYEIDEKPYTFLTFLKELFGWG